MTLGKLQSISCGWWFALAAAAVLGVASMVLPTRAQAQTCTVLYHGRCEWRGYFSNTLDTGGGTVLTQSAGVSIPASVNTVTEFVNLLKARNAATASARDRTGSAFIYYTMVGRDGGNYSRTITAAQWTDLTARMNAMTINWNSSYTRANSLNSYWQGEDKGFANDGTTNDDAYYREDLASENSITFTDSGGTLRYRVLRRCANPVGGSGLPSATFDIVGETTVRSGTKTASSNSGTGDITVSPGDLVTWSGFVQNNGPASAPAVSWRRVNMPSGTIMSSGGPNAYVDGQRRNVWNETNFVIPPAATNGQRFCRAAYWSPASSVNPSLWQTTGEACAVVFDPPNPVCGNLQILSPVSAPEAGDTVQLRVNVTNGAPAPVHPYALNLTVTGPGGPWTRAGGDVTSLTYTIPTPLAGGTYTATWSFTTSSPGVGITAPPCSDTFTVSSKPYFRVYNGDIQAGAVFSPCNSAGTPDAGEIKGHNAGSTNSYKGAGSQIAAIAYDAIDEFTSASLRGSGPVKPKGLSFASGGSYGGNFDQGACIPDYWSIAPASPPSSLTLNTTNLAAGAKTDYFVEGDVYITGTGIRYGGTWNLGLGTNDIPSFRLIVYNGNIYINNSVTQLDGTYIALPDSSGANGVIYTCATAAGTPATPAQIPGSCTNRLTVNGAFVARQIKLMRSSGSVNSAPANETLGAGVPAEVFNYSPASWLANPATLPPDDSTYDALIGLPPVL